MSESQQEQIETSCKLSMISFALKMCLRAICQSFDLASPRLLTICHSVVCALRHGRWLRTPPRLPEPSSFYELDLMRPFP